MKKLFLLCTLVSTFAFGQIFTIKDFLTVTKITKEQLEAKYSLTSESNKTEKNGTVYLYSVKDTQGVDWKLMITPSKTTISKAVLSTMSPTKNKIFAEYSYVFDKFIEKRVLVDNKSKTEIPYFTKDEFSDAYYRNEKNGDAETLKTKTAVLYGKAIGANLIFANDSNIYSITATPSK
ncbi:hypothetical protein [Kaistella antarctica]|uniref:Uncharacterized protein n=1 Tax=Kaistella antarctica TaxID=266748 RepID=A0A448NSU2_9FLAO|nr:hypothetical protein [Kaistella antarctica]KEY17954.1 hypothetical protein HY04_05340 [Kaistella antarctica]SEV81592.1 hypothetical protein SAMN05421765_0268 [Kaistella antarctica]VEI00376.1 Uncharacterised protein [Kaistella antarctica]